MIEAERSHIRAIVGSGRLTATTHLATWAVCFCVTLSVAVAAHGQGSIPRGDVLIMNVHSRLCISPAGGADGKNVQIVQFTCDQDPSRRWRFDVVDGDIVKIRNFGSGLCLTIAGGQTERNIAAVQFTCDNDPSRRWRYAAIDATRFRLVNVKSGLCLTIAGGGTAGNATAVQFPCDGDPSRDWEITQVVFRQ